jgi:hypothetical protein
MKKLFSTFCLTVAAASAFALTPAEAEVKATLDGIENAAEQGKLFTALCDALPAKQQKAFYDLSQAFAKKMDPMVWNSGKGVLDAVGKVFATKSDFIVNSAMAKDTLLTGKPAAADFAIAGKLIQSIASISLDEIKAQPNAKAFAAFLDSKVGKLPKSENQASYIVTTDEDGDVVVCFDTETGINCENCIEFEKVAGKWIPEEWEDVDGIYEVIAVINQFDFNSEEGSQIKMQAIMFSSMLNGMLAPILQAKTQEEFDAAIAALSGASEGL